MGAGDRAWQLAAVRLREADATQTNQAREISSLRLHIGVLLTRISQITDDGGG